MIRHASRRLVRQDRGKASPVRRRASRLLLLLHLLGVALLETLPAAPAFAGGTEDLDLLARTIYHEASGEGRDGMVAIGWVVLNRTRDRSFPASVGDVVTERAGASCQWSWACRSLPAPRGASWHLARDVASMMLSDPPPDPTNGAVWIRQRQAAPPSFGIPVVETARIGNHTFYGRPLRHFTR